MISKTDIKKDSKKLKLLKDSVFLQHFKALENELLKVISKNEQLVKEFKELGEEYNKIVNDLNDREKDIINLINKCDFIERDKNTSIEAFKELSDNYLEEIDELNKKLIYQENFCSDEIRRANEAYNCLKSDYAELQEENKELKNKLEIISNENFNLVEVERKRQEDRFDLHFKVLVDCEEIMKTKPKSQALTSVYNRIRTFLETRE